MPLGRVIISMFITEHFDVDRIGSTKYNLLLVPVTNTLLSPAVNLNILLVLSCFCHKTPNFEVPGWVILTCV